MNWGETASAVMVGVLAAQMSYNLMRYSFLSITGKSVDDAAAERLARRR